MSSSSTQLLSAVTSWLESERTVEAAILYGSSARSKDDAAAADQWSDLDLHVITRDPGRIELTNWALALPGQGFVHRAGRAAAGGVNKLRLLFAAGEVELVIMPTRRLRVARLGLRLGCQRHLARLRDGLNVLATGLGSGYRFIKGEEKWGPFYADVVREMSGLRMPPREICDSADLFICDLLSCFQRIERGELLAAQRALHRSLAETNFVLARELRLRRKLPVPSFEPARRIEQLYDPETRALVQVDARLDAAQLRQAAWKAWDALLQMMRALEPEWKPAAGVEAILAPHRPS